MSPPCYRPCLTEHLIRVAPFVVVPAHDLDQIAIDDLGELKIDDGRAWVTDDVRRDQRVTRYSEHSGIALAGGLFREHLIYLVDAGLPRGHERDVDDRANGKRRSHRNTVKQARIL